MQTSAIKDQEKVQNATNNEGVPRLIFWVSQGPVLEHHHDRDAAVRITH